MKTLQKSHGVFFLVGWFHFFLLSPLLGEIVQFDEYFSDGLVQPPPFCWELLDHWLMKKYDDSLKKPSQTDLIIFSQGLL